MAGFPIFVEVGKHAPLVVGNGDLALAKVRVLLLRAPRVDVIETATRADGFDALIASGQLVCIDAPANEDTIRGRPLVISASTDKARDDQVSRIARSLGVPINVPDRPDVSTFSLAALVDRGTVMVAIGTDGAAPVLATRLRAEIEQHLPPRIGRLADVAREMRDSVANALPPGNARRAFWNEVFGGPAAQAILNDQEAEGQRLIEAKLTSSSAQSTQGRVMLVGAGPGDPDLLTLKAVRALKQADVVVHDGLMGDAVLDHARREAQLISVAKAKGHHGRTQAEINALLIDLARQGKLVVRLKCGDPSIFGRAGEEIDALRASEIDVEVIPGVTAASAAAASLQIPLTHRDISRSVTLISGHAAGDGAAEFDQMDFAALANGRATLAVYMARSTAHLLAARLIESGWPETIPVIAVAEASQARERRVATTLAGLIAAEGKLGLSGPTLLVIGEVAGLDANGPVERAAVQQSRAPTNTKSLGAFAHA